MLLNTFPYGNRKNFPKITPPSLRYWLCNPQIWQRNHSHFTTSVLRPFFRDHPGEPVPEENFRTLWCKGRLKEADTLTIRLGATPSGLTSAHIHHRPIFLQAGCPSCRPTNSIKALKATDLALKNSNKLKWLIKHPKWQPSLHKVLLQLHNPFSGQKAIKRM